MSDEQRFIAEVIKNRSQRLVDFNEYEWELVGELINAGVVELVHGAWRSEDYVRITDAGRAALETPDA